MTISRTIREQVTCQLRDEIIAGDMGPGSVLREAELAKRFGVSRGPVRDAFLQLSNEGYLAYEPNRGVTVRHPPDQSDRDFIADLRRQIEIHVVTRGINDLTGEAIARVSTSLDVLKAGCLAEDHAAIKRGDLEFHEAILLECGGESLLPAWKQLCSRMALTYERLSKIDLIYAEHERIFNALKQKDLGGIIQALSENIT